MRGNPEREGGRGGRGEGKRKAEVGISLPGNGTVMSCERERKTGSGTRVGEEEDYGRKCVNMLLKNVVLYSDCVGAVVSL